MNIPIIIHNVPPGGRTANTTANTSVENHTIL